MNYTLNQLRIFVKIAQTQSITKAAEELHLTQPAVSIQLKNFQNQFEISLTEVIGKKLYITEFGCEIAVAAENILNHVYEINYKTLAFKGQLTGRLKISSVSTGKYVIPYFLSEFLTINNGIELILDVSNKESVVRNLENNDTDFALVSVLPENLKCEKIELLQNKLYVVSNSSTLYKKKVYDKSIFEGLPLIYREPGSGTRKIMEQYIEQKKLPARKKLELVSNEAVKQAVISGLGCSILPLIGIKNELQNSSLQIIPVQGFPIKSVWCLIWLKGKKMSPVAAAYLAYVKKERNEIINKWFDWYEKY